MAGSALLLCVILMAVAGNAGATDRPIIGIMTQPVSTEDGGETGEDGEMLAASYVKFVEGAGARVVAVRYTWEKAHLESMFGSLNGLLLPGGGASLNPANSAYYAAGRTLYELAVAANERGDHFPIWGTCLGFEQLMVLAAGNNYSVLTDSGKFDAHDVNFKVNLTERAASSTLLGTLPEELKNALVTEAQTYNSHQDGITPAVFADDPLLPDFFSVLGTSRDVNGKEFVAAAEARDFPFFAVQWHPEKSLFEWSSKTQIPHDAHASALAQHYANIFVAEARKSEHSFVNETAEKEAVIANETPTYLPDGYFQQVYYFGETLSESMLVNVLSALSD